MLSVDGVDITSDTEIAEEFANFFIGKVNQLSGNYGGNNCRKSTLIQAYISLL